MAYTALYRQWRPQNFDTLVGQSAVKTALKNALSNDKIAHAYLFSGPRGTGKTSTARILAKALNCLHGLNGEPCGECSNCKHITEGTSMDVFEIDAASNTGVDEIKDLCEQVAFSPVESRYKVYIIDEVHMLSKGAFNALLKTLEEPPEHVVFILATTDPQKVPETIHSRCQRFEFRRVTLGEITEHLQMVADGSGIQADKEALHLIAVQAEGGMRDALSLLDQCGVMGDRVTVDIVRNVLGIVGRDLLHDLIKSIGEMQLSAALSKLNLLLEKGKDAHQILSELMEYMRALLLFKTVPEYSEIYLTDTKDAFEKLAPLFGQERLLAVEERLHTAVLELKNTPRPRITMELCLVDLCRMEGSTLAALNARVEKLEQQLLRSTFIQTTASAEQQKVQEIASVELIQSEIPASGDKLTVKESKVIETLPVEKKIMTKQQEPSASVSAAETSNLTANEEYAGDFAAGEDYWKQAMDILKAERKNSMVACAKSGRVFSFVDNVLQIVFKAAFFAERINKDDYRKAFENALLRVARREIRLEAVVEGEVKKPKIFSNPVQKAEQNIQPLAVDKKLLPENLRKAADVFGGVITDISDQN